VFTLVEGNKVIYRRTFSTTWLHFDFFSLLFYRISSWIQQDKRRGDGSQRRGGVILPSLRTSDRQLAGRSGGAESPRGESPALLSILFPPGCIYYFTLLARWKCLLLLLFYRFFLSSFSLRHFLFFDLIFYCLFFFLI
jgi:hypothetical protein